MLFKDYHIEMIISGSKIETRRIWTKPHVKIGGIYPIQTKMFQKKNECKLIKVNYIFKQKLKDVTNDQADKEGYSNLNEFKKAFKNITNSWNGDQEVYAIGFEYFKSDNDKRSLKIHRKYKMNYKKMKNEIELKQCPRVLYSNDMKLKKPNIRCPFRIKHKKICKIHPSLIKYCNINKIEYDFFTVFKCII
ncbi:MAG: ASCH domain-containing protein [Candidatus Thermoplasmatota archaeon]|nr:ASCH domain-containing protein [Candidatus Thermoplasmatota archaeon]